MNDSEHDSDDSTSSARCVNDFTDSGVQQMLTKTYQYPNKFSDLFCRIRNKCISIPSLEHEIEFQQIKAKIRKQADENHEAMNTLDIIDAKAQSLLSYISISIAVFVFILSQLQSSNFIKYLIFILLILLSITMLLCLPCVDIIGAHTIKNLKSKEEVNRLKEYNNLIFALTLKRRNYYLIAHRLSLVTAILCILIMVLLIFTYK